MKKIISNLLPSFFDTSEGSNISKIIQIFSEEIESFRGDATKVDNWKMIDAAKAGDIEAMEQLTLEDMDTYTAVSSRSKKEDLFQAYHSRLNLKKLILQ